MSQTNDKVIFQEPAAVLPHNIDEFTLNSTGKRIVISKIAQLLFSYGTKKSFSTGHYIIREGHSDKTVFILLSGEVEILKKDKDGNDRVVTKLSKGGTILGEMSIFLDEPRTSSVRISADALTLVFTGENFLAAVVNTPDLAMRIMKSLSNKLKSANEQLILSNTCETRVKQVDKGVTEKTAEE